MTYVESSSGTGWRVESRREVREPGCNRSTKSVSGQYRPEVDGLRAVAVLGVVFYHADGLAPGGYVGVDVFFVISGFLITSLIRKDLEADKFRLSSFWERRIRRIFPAQVLMVSVVLGAGMLLFLPRDYYDLSKSALAQSVFLSNVYFLRHLGYFDGPAELKPLLHMWSLAVEEQFYLGFPLFLLACRGLRRSTISAILALLAIASFTLSIWGTRTYPAATFFLLPTRAWEFLLGSLLSSAPRGPLAPIARKWLREAGSALGLLGIFGAFAVFDQQTPFPGAAALLPCGGAALIIHFNHHGRTWSGRLLALRPFVFVGLISYSLYLWHWPAMALRRYLNHDILGGWPCAYALAGSCVAAYLSWKYIETPFRRGTARASGIRVFSTVSFVSAAIVAVSFVGWHTHGLPQRFSGEIQELIEGEDVPVRFRVSEIDDVVAGRLPIFGDLSRAAMRPCFLLWGDSHAMAISELIDQLAIEHGIVGYAACHDAMPPVMGASCGVQDISAVDWNRAVFEFVRRNKIRHVLLAARWSVYIERSGNESTGFLLDDAMSRGLTSREAKLTLKRGLERTIEELRRAEVSVWIIKQIPEQRQDPRRALTLAKLLPWRAHPKGISLSEHRLRQMNVDEVLGEFESADVHLLDPTDACFDRWDDSRVGGDNQSYYADDDHLSPTGAEVLLSGLLESCFSAITCNGCNNND